MKYFFIVAILLIILSPILIAIGLIIKNLFICYWRATEEERERFFNKWKK